MRRSFDDAANAAMLPEAVDPGDRLLPCAFCQSPTKHKVLATLGARCQGCFKAYCERLPAAPNVGDKRQGAKSWAYALKEREESGELLSGLQKRMWRECLGVPA